MAVKIFICYAREDETLLNKLKMHLRPLQRQGLIEVWHDCDISAGAEWEQEISEQLNSAHIILLLISADFMDSNYCYGVEMQRAMERHERKEARVIPVILRPVYWHEAPFGRLQALPKDAKPVTSSNWHNWDDAFFDVVEGIRNILIQLNEPKTLGVQVRFNLQDISYEEKLSRTTILTKLRQLYVLSHDKISPGIMAGIEPLPKAWVEEQLEKMGETWRQDTYYGEVMELSNIQLLFIQTIFDYFHEQGSWPTYGYVEREISRIHRDFDMRGVSRSLPNGFANAFAFNIDRKQEALLKVPAILLCKGSEHDLTDFVQVLQYCVNKYFSFEENHLQITSDEVKMQLNMSELSIRKVGRLIEVEGMFWSSLGRNDTEGSWVCALMPGMKGIARFDKIETIEQYLEKLDQNNKSFVAPTPQLSINRGASPHGEGLSNVPPHEHFNGVEDDATAEGGREDLLTVREVARRLRVDDTTIRRWIKSGALEAITLPHRGQRQAYRIKKSTLDELLSGSIQQLT
jgi:excisionase family DNA binding protein